MLKKHVIQRHKLDKDLIDPTFADSTGKVADLPIGKQLNGQDKNGYITWLAGLAERIISTLHPRLPGMELRQSDQLYKQMRI
jgi:hypothetical protein